MFLDRDLTRLLVKIFGLIIFLSALVGLPWRLDAFFAQLSVVKAVGALHGWQALALLGSYFGPFAIYAAVGLGLIWGNGRVVERISSTSEPAEVAHSLDLRELETILVAVLGLYLFAEGLAELCRWAFTLASGFLLGHLTPLIVMFWTGDIGLMVQAVMKLIVGIFLMLGRGGSVAVRRRLQDWVRKWRTWPH